MAVQQASELRELYLRTYEAFSTGDLSVYENLLSHQAGLLIIGTDPQEWWEDYGSMIEIMQAQVAGMHDAGLQIVPGEVRAYQEGTVGWVIDRPTLRMPNGQEFSFRQTAIFHQEDGAWKMIHVYVSIGVPNAEVEPFRDVAD